MSKINESVEYVFVVKDASDFEPYITIEPRGNDISVFKNAMLSFHLEKGTSHEEAHEVAKVLNDNIKYINFQEI